LFIINKHQNCSMADFRFIQLKRRIIGMGNTY
jgi:hypothetical protein